MSASRLLTAIARTRRTLANRRGTAFVEYTSLVLLIAIAALAVLTGVHSGGISN